jgi:hypothetical protein
LKTLIGVQRHVLDPLAKAGKGTVLSLRLEERQFCSQKSSVPCRLNFLRGEADQADALRTGAVNIVPKGPRKIEFF